METENNDDPELQGPANEVYLRSPYRRQERNAYFRKGRPLYKAARNGKWEDVRDIFQNDADAGCAYITEGFETPLHISALAGNVKFVRKLLEVMDEQDLAITNKKGNTAFCLAAANGNVATANLLIRKNPRLGNICGPPTGILPVMMAAKLGNGKMVERLIQITDLTDEVIKSELLNELIASDLFGIAQKMIEDNPGLAVSDKVILETLAAKPMAERTIKEKLETFLCFGMKKEDSQQIQALDLLKYILKLVFTENGNALNIQRIVAIAGPLLFDAAEQGNFHLFKWLIYYYPELVWKTNSVGVSMFHVAVKYRNKSIFALLHKMDEVRKLVTTYVEENTGNTMLHVAATLAPKDKLDTVNGAAFQMQQAICWYKAVEKIVPPAYRNRRNGPHGDGSTPGDIFDDAHKDLLKDGEKWMKATAKSCMVVAALSATVLFASAFTVPGDYNNEGHPNLLNRASFDFLTISEVIGMLSSSTSILMLLSILTSRFNKYAFQSSLPCKLMIGLTALSVSILSMVLAFCAAIYLSYDRSWVLGLLSPLVFVTTLLVLLRFRLLCDIIRSTRVSRSLFPSSSLSFVSRFLFQSSCLSNY